jgi:peptidoglycan hydrolase-like protein with peptidoglycan-binding domain
MSLDWPVNQAGYVYRALRLTEPRQQGWDVYALQNALNAFRADLATDGVLGTKTAEAIVTFQRSRDDLIGDGIAGVATQQKITAILARRVNEGLGLPNGLPYGQLEHESACLLGNNSPVRSDGTYDAGVAQQNTRYTHPTLGFNPVASVNRLGTHLRDKYNEYYPKVRVSRRSWELAVGSWNAPAWTDKLASGGTLTQTQSDWIEAYIDGATAYVVW